MCVLPDPVPACPVFDESIAPASRMGPEDEDADDAERATLAANKLERVERSLKEARRKAS